MARARCTSSQRSTSRRRRSSKQKKKAAARTSSTVCVCWTRRACALCRGPGSGRRRTRCIFARRFWHRGRIGWAGLRSSIVSSWMSLGGSVGVSEWGKWKGLNVGLEQEGIRNGNGNGERKSVCCVMHWISSVSTWRRTDLERVCCIIW